MSKKKIVRCKHILSERTEKKDDFSMDWELWYAVDPSRVTERETSEYPKIARKTDMVYLKLELRNT